MLHTIYHVYTNHSIPYSLAYQVLGWQKLWMRLLLNPMIKGAGPSSAATAANYIGLKKDQHHSEASSRYKRPVRSIPYEPDAM